MAKMFYTIDEVKTMLGLDDDAVRALVKEGKLRELLDGSRRVFKAEQVEAMAAQAPSKAPASPAATDASGFALEMADTGAGVSGAPKVDIAIGDEGVQDLAQDQPGLADTDAVAKGSGSGEGMLQLDGSGSGSGLLDLTREGDDTSLGAVLDEIYPGEDNTPAGMGTGLASALGSDLTEAQGVEASAMAEQMAPPSPSKAARPFVAAMILAVVLLGLAISALVAVFLGVMPVYLTTLFDSLLYFLIGSLVVAVVIFVLGAILGGRRA